MVSRRPRAIPVVGLIYEELLAKAPPHDSPEFLEYLRAHNPVLWEDESWLVIQNVKYGWPTAFAKKALVSFKGLEERYGHLEWKKKRSGKQTIRRFHVHIDFSSKKV